ncbi:MAG TPA: hypothetical protein VJN88_00690 [Ktedonobacterales bacterium]|nr:hypothetical protein [Ktedonobacterales bacterium]
MADSARHWTLAAFNDVVRGADRDSLRLVDGPGSGAESIQQTLEVRPVGVLGGVAAAKISLDGVQILAQRGFLGGHGLFLPCS